MHKALYKESDGVVQIFSNWSPRYVRNSPCSAMWSEPRDRANEFSLRNEVSITSSLVQSLHIAERSPSLNSLSLGLSIYSLVFFFS